MNERGLGRRDALAASLAAGGVFVLGFSLEGCKGGGPEARMAEQFRESGAFAPSAWIKITPASQVIVVLDRVEMGQGTMTSYATLVAEELELEPATIVIEHAPADRSYDNKVIGFQITGGSTSMKASFGPLRKAAATARDMLRQAAALEWSVPVSECTLDHGFVLHGASKRRVPLGAFVRAAAALPIPNSEPKPEGACTLLGRPTARVDARTKVDGSAIYGLDVRVAGMLAAVVVRSPIVGGALRGFRDGGARNARGVRHVVAIGSGVAVVAQTYWQASSAARLIEADFGPGALGLLDSASIEKALHERGKSPGSVARNDGDFDTARAGAFRQLEATYDLPYLPHLTMEPMNATAWVRNGQCDVWAPTQSAALARESASRASGLGRDAIEVHTTLLGGGFGRRLVQDYVVDAVEISKATGEPIQLVYGREDDTRADFFRPQTRHVMKGAINARGEPVAWFHRVVGPSLLAHVTQEWAYPLLPDWMPSFLRGALGSMFAGAYGSGLVHDAMSTEGAADTPYEWPNARVEFASCDARVPIGFWRSVGHSFNAFAVESFVDEMAHAAGRDPYRFRRELLTKSPRDLAVIDLAAEKAGWGTALRAGVFRGIARHTSFDTRVAQVAEITMVGGMPRVERVVAAIDCGFAINPDIVAAQVEGAIAYGLGAALFQRVTFKDGRIEQSNFHDLPVLRMHEMPRVEVHVMASRQPPSGVGEPGLPPIAPAVANAVFAATGKRVRRLPFASALETVPRGKR